jgi:hypothetical protein
LKPDPPSPSQLGEIVILTGIEDPSDMYLSKAVRYVLSIEDDPRPKDVFVGDRQREEIAVTCVLAFLSLEASINRLFFEAFEAERPTRAPLSTIPSSTLSFVKRSWHRMPVREKWLVLPPLLGPSSIEISTPLVILFDEFIRFRNRLVHPKATGTKTTVRTTNIQTTSWGGEVMDHSVAAPPTDQLFPVTRLTTSLNGLRGADAEKCVEIAYRMRMAVWADLGAAPPILLYDAGGHARVAIGDSIGDLLQQRGAIHFGPLPSKGQ